MRFDISGNNRATSELTSDARRFETIDSRGRNRFYAAFTRGCFVNKAIICVTSFRLWRVTLLLRRELFSAIFAR